eukprot:gene18925-20829_t
MASRMRTIESDEEVEDFEESGDDELEEKKTLKRRKSQKNKPKKDGDFNEDFIFEFKNNNDDEIWKIDKKIRNSAKGQISSYSMEERIIAKRKERKKRTKNSENDIGNKENETIDADEEKIEKSEKLSDAKDEISGNHPEKAVNELGFLHPTPIQCSTIPVALLGKDVCACAATGTGKTAAYMLPVLERLLFRPKQVPVSRVLVLVPTRELAVQVHSVSLSLAKYVDVQICLAAGGLRMKDQETALRRGPDIIIATPGRLVDHLHNTPSFDLQSIEILVLDEADRMLEEHFEAQMKEIIRLCQRGRQTMLFSATMTDQVEELVSLSLNHPVRLFVDQNTDVASCLQQEFVRIRPTREDDRLAIVTAMCCRSFSNNCMVFCQTKKLAHTLRIILGLCGLKVGELHGDLSQLQRLEALQMFKSGDIGVLVATDLAARGLDISGVKTVISFNMPNSYKSYVHRVGRTARAGKFGRSITLVGEKERKNLKIAVKNSSLPVKNRILSPDIIIKYKKLIKDMQKDIADILKQEAEEKELILLVPAVMKANIDDQNFAIVPKKSESEILKKQNTKKKESESDKKVRLEQEYLKRSMKRESKPKRLRACPVEEDTKTNVKGKPVAKKAKMESKKRKGFDKELTDTSKKSLKEFRSKQSFGGPKKAPGRFKSKKK